MPNIPNNPTRFHHSHIRTRLQKFQLQNGLSDTARQILHNEIEAAARYWFIQAGGSVEDFEVKFNSEKK